MKKKLIKLLSKKYTILSVFFIVIIAFILFGESASAAGFWANTVVGGIARWVVSAVGWILAKVMGVFIYLAQYNNFIGSSAVIEGWRVSRDIANMFFIVILLIIAFATILQVEKYNYKQWLPKLILMAVLINFSKTICGLLIDISQVVMLTFVNAFSEIGAGKLTEMLGIEKWQRLDDVGKINDWEIAAAYLLAAFYAIIALATILAMTAMLVMRIIMIWVYVVLSPFAYLLASFPGGVSYSSRWWSEFTKNLLIGPVLAFFVWLSFASLGNPNKPPEAQLSGIKGGETDITCQVDENGVCKQGTSAVMTQFIVAIAMLIGGMKIAQEIGGAAGGAAGKAMGKLKGAGLVLGGAAGGYALAGTKWAGKKTAKGVGAFVSAADKEWGHARDLKKGTNRYGDKGFIGTNLLAVKNAANRKIDILRGRRPMTPEQQELAQKNRDYFENRKQDKGKSEVDRATMEYNNKEYRMETQGVNKGKMVEVDAATRRNTATVLSSDGKEVKAMTATSAALYDAKKQSFSSDRTEVNKAQEKKVDNAQTKFTDMNLSSGEIDRKLASAATSLVDKMALAMIKASKGAFKNKTEVDEFKKLLSVNPSLSSKFDDEMDAKRPDLNYDFNSDIGRNRFKKRLANGKIDLTKAGEDAFADEDFLGAIEEQKGVNFAPTIQNMIKDKGAAAMANLDTGLSNLKMKKYTDASLNPTQQRDEGLKIAKVQADINGNWGEAFKNQSGDLDRDGLAQYVISAKGKNLNNMDVKDFESNQEVKDTVISNITVGQLTAMMLDGSNAELVRAIREDIKDRMPTSNIRQNIEANAALSTY